MGQFLQRPAGQGPVDEDGVTWYCRFFARVAGTLAALLAMILGLYASLSFSPKCVAAGILQIFFGFILMTLEAPCCCTWLDFIEKIMRFSERRKHWHKALLYCCMGLLPIIVCASISIIFGSGPIFFTGALYAMFSFGKKADQATMMSRADSVTSRSDLVANAQGIPSA